MCKKKHYCGSRIDECLQEEIENINREGILRTISSCCGHGKYNPTIIVENLNSDSKNVFEWYSHAVLKRPKRNRFYKKDRQGYYYLNLELIIGENLIYCEDCGDGFDYNENIVMFWNKIGKWLCDTCAENYDRDGHPYDTNPQDEYDSREPSDYFKLHPNGI